MVVSTENKNLVISVIRLQKKLHLSDQVIADKMNISRSLWQQIRTGDRGIGVAFLRGICSAFPTLQDEVLNYLNGNNNEKL